LSFLDLDDFFVSFWTFGALNLARLSLK